MFKSLRINKRRLLYLHRQLGEILFWDLTTEVEKVMLVWKGIRVIKIIIPPFLGELER